MSEMRLSARESECSESRTSRLCRIGDMSVMRLPLSSSTDTLVTDAALGKFLPLRVWTALYTSAFDTPFRRHLRVMVPSSWNCTQRA